MRRRPNPYRVLAHALDVGDGRLAELLIVRLTGPGRAAASAARPAPGADAAVERLLAFLAISRAPG